MRRSMIVVALFALIGSFLVPFSTHAAGDVSSRRALSTVLSDVKFDNISLSDAIDFLRDSTGANIHVNWHALESAGIGKDVTVNVRLRGVSVRKALNMVLSEAGAGGALTYYTDQNVIEVTTKELADQQLYTKVYPVDDLLMEVPDFVGPDFQINQGNQTGGGGGGSGVISGNAPQDTKSLTRSERAAQLVETIQAIIQPEIWNVNGGTAAIRFYNGSLIVTAPRSVHEALGGEVD